MSEKKLRTIDAPFVALGPSGVAIRDRLKHLTDVDDKVLRLVGEHLGRFASLDIKNRCADGLDHNSDTWAARKQGLTADSSSRWDGSITKATHDQWALSRRCQLAHIQGLEAGVRTLMHRLSQPIGEKGTKRAPGGYRSRAEWFQKSRRLTTLEHRLDVARAEPETGVVHVVRGGRRLLNNRHDLEAAQLTAEQWRDRWEAQRWFLAADGESGKRFGNETIRVTPDGEVSIKLPAQLAHLANSKHGRYVLATRVQFQHRGADWRDRLEDNRAVAYRIHLDVERGRWYLTASWTRPVVQTIPLQTARSEGMVGVDTNADHFAAYRLDRHGNPVGDPKRFFYDLSGRADHRDAQVRHAISQLLHWADRCGVKAIGLENLDFATEETREKHGRRKRFRQIISGNPTGKLKAGSCPWRPNTACRSSPWTRRTHRCGAISTGRSPSPRRNEKRPVTMPLASRSGDAPSGTRSGDGRHRPRSTRAMLRGIGPSRPDQAHEGVRKPAHPSRSVHTMHAAGRGHRERGRPSHPTPFGTRAVPGADSKCHSCTLFRNG